MVSKFEKRIKKLENILFHRRNLVAENMFPIKSLEEVLNLEKKVQANAEFAVELVYIIA